MQNQFNGNSTPEGKRNGVAATEIADTLDALFAYFETTRKNDPAFLKAIIDEADGWRAAVAALRGADQKAVDFFFGQPARGDVKAALSAQGMTEDSADKNEYRSAYIEMTQSMTTDPQSYWPGKVVPTLSDYRSILDFDAYRETLDGKMDGPAAALLKRIDAFQGGFGSKHGSGRGLIHAITKYINTHPRHPAETYVQPAEVYCDYLNAFDHTYSPHVHWRPTDDMSQVKAVVSCATWASPEERNMAFAQEKVKFEAALGRGGIQADVKVVLGKTYADDALVVTMSMEDYTKRFIPIKCGKIQIDLSLPGRNDDASLGTVKYYDRYEPGKPAFFESSDLLLSAETMKALDADFPEKRFEGAAEALRFARGVKGLDETHEQIPVAPGQKADYIRLHRVERPFEPPVIEFEGLYYDSCDTHNKLNVCLSEVEAAVNDHDWTEHRGSREPKKPDDVSFEHNGDMYIPQGEKNYQIALHMKYKYGTDYTWVINDDDAKAKAKGRDKYVIFTGKLGASAHDAAVAEVNEMLRQDWNPHDIHAATVLRKKMKVGKPLSLGPKT